MTSQSQYSAKIKIFSDGADKSTMLDLNKNPLIKGMTTNPTLMKKAGIKDYKGFCLEILKEIKTKPLSFEVFADDFNEMEKQAMEIASWGQNIYVKIPITNSEGQSSIPLIKKLSHSKVKLNVTALLTLKQVSETCDAVAGGSPSIVSVFAGRIADTGRDPVPLMQASLELCRNGGDEVELLWASSRELFNIIQADLIGCHIITATPDIISKLSMLNKDLTQLSLETVRMFKKDADAAGFQL
jgi:transaldolase